MGVCITPIVYLAELIKLLILACIVGKSSVFLFSIMILFFDVLDPVVLFIRVDCIGPYVYISRYFMKYKIQLILSLRLPGTMELGNKILRSRHLFLPRINITKKERKNFKIQTQYKSKIKCKRALFPPDSS